MNETFRGAGGRIRLLGAIAALLGLLAATLFVVNGPSTATAKSGSPATAQIVAVADKAAPQKKPTIVMVHGAFADASGWQAVAQNLMKQGYPVYAPPNPLRGLAGDAEYLKSFLATIKGPIILVGHSYGGAVITNAATGNSQVKGLVYIAAYALDEGETVGAANALGGHPEESLLLDNVQPRPYPGAPTHDGQTDVDVYIKKDAFRKVFAADVDARTASFMAAAQRPGSLFSLGTPSGVPAWKSIPSYYLVATEDKAIPPTAERFMAKRAKALTWKVKSSHVAMISQPTIVTKLVVCAATGKC